MERWQQFISELRRRRVFRALVGWGILSFAVLQVIEPIMHALGLGEWTLKVVVGLLGLGFPVSAALSWAYDLRRTGIERTPATAPEGTGAPTSPRTGRVRLAVLLLGLGAAAASPGLIYFFVWPGAARRPAEKVEAGPAARAAPSIAVLAFADMSPGKDQEYFADGLTEELLNLLAKVPGLRVAARTSAFAFKGKNEDVTQIGQKLHVAHILEGSVRKWGDQIRITTQLINVSDSRESGVKGRPHPVPDRVAVGAGRLVRVQGCDRSRAGHARHGSCCVHREEFIAPSHLRGEHEAVVCFPG